VWVRVGQSDRLVAVAPDDAGDVLRGVQCYELVGAPAQSGGHRPLRIDAHAGDDEVAEVGANVNDRTRESGLRGGDVG
jgi:hypothetical protein